MNLTLLIIIGIPLLSILVFLCEEMTLRGKKVFNIISIILLCLMAIAGVVLNINLYVLR